jgi:hypothetical protein
MAMQEATIGRVVVCVDQVVGASSAALMAAWGLLRPGGGYLVLVELE